MKRNGKKISRLSMQDRAELALQVAVRNAITGLFRRGLPVYIWRKGRVVKLSKRDWAAQSR
jgi:hypothetical protein